ncbi:MAG: Kelch repeat-containing protein [Isosphaeraceae bacterium]
MLHPHRLSLVILALNLSLAVRAGEPISPSRADGSSTGPALEWTQAAPSPFARVEAPAAIVKGSLYVFGGFTDELNASQQVNVYDPATDTWARKKDMPAGLTHLNAVVEGDHIWFAGGFKGKHPGAATTEVWKYDVAADRWVPGPPLPEPRAGGGLALADHRLHYFGGYLPDRNTNTGDHWSLASEGENEWQREPDMPDPRGHLAAAVLDGKIYALGGDHGHDVKQVDVSSCHRFDPKARKWIAIASFPDGRSHFESSTIIHQGRILVVGGRCNSSQPPRDVVGDILAYDPHADRWLVVGELPAKLLAPAAAIISGRLVVTGGGLNNPRPLTATTRIAAFPSGE